MSFVCFIRGHDWWLVGFDDAHSDLHRCMRCGVLEGMGH